MSCTCHFICYRLSIRTPPRKKTPTHHTPVRAPPPRRTFNEDEMFGRRPLEMTSNFIANDAQVEIYMLNLYVSLS